MFAKKSLGQNFLMHRQTAERIVEAAGVTGNDTVLEIGPGTGMLTRALLAKGQKVIALEADFELIPKLEAEFATEIENGSFELISGDARSFNPETIGKSYILVANIPYYITGELIRKFLTTKHKPVSITFLVQKEVAVRIARTKKESLLSLSVKAFGTPAYRFTVPRGAFYPAPNVDSAVLSITDIHTPFASDIAETQFFDVLHAGFAHKRKQLAKNLEGSFSKESVANALELTKLPRTVRAEDVSLSSWITLANLIHRKN
jgi:16S rRNA (adenine1518-N6/adenine1519-N6)-dimethyltransferase